MPTYGSGGYDWGSMPEIWFDSALIGTLGSLNSFVGDERDAMPAPERIAKYNGLCQVLRPSNYFTIEPVDADYLSVTRGAHTSSWARFESGELFGVALRTCRLDGRCSPVKYRDIVQTTASLVAASKTDDSLDKSARLAVVPYGEGELVLLRGGSQASQAIAIEHYFGGSSNQSRIEIRDGGLRLPLREQGENGSPLEWIEVNFTG